jgi:organic radical activating enzyme
MNNTDVKWLHVELSSKCNAWCPACPRNKSGFGIIDNLVEEDLTTHRLEQILGQLPNLETVQLCGNYGDPIAATNILDAIKLIKNAAKKIQIHSNGSLRNTQWWKNFAKELADIDHDVWFGIDGLKGVHEIYRQGTDFNKVIENAQAFIDAGGYATWQFIPYEHNQHQLKDCIRLSQKLKFKKFKLAQFSRNKKTVYHHITGEKFELNPVKELKNVIRIYKNFNDVEESDCTHLTQSSIYVAANGKVNYCCYKGQISQKQFDSVDNLLYNKSNLAEKICFLSCRK